MRIVVLGDDGVGKSSIVTCLFKDRFVANIEDLVPPLFFPGQTDEKVVVADTSPALSFRPKLLNELRHASCIWLVYSDHYTMQRVSLFWLPFLRTNGVNLPVILCQNKQDQLFSSEEDLDTAAGGVSLEEEDDVIQMMQDFKEIESFVRCSAKMKRNVNEAFYLCQRAVLHPLAPLYDSKIGQLKPLCQEALNRVFFLLDEDQSGVMTRPKLDQLQQLVFNQPLSNEEISLINETLVSIQSNSSSSPELYSQALNGITLPGFRQLAQIYCERGRHETIWAILRHFHYTDSLSLDEKFLRPSFAVDSAVCRVELSPNGYQFLVDLFTLFDRDNDGGLCPNEIQRLFAPTPGLPDLWKQLNFPHSTLCNDDGFVSLQGWLAQWSMYVYLQHQNALAYLAMLGYNQRSCNHNLDIRSALRVTKPARKRNPQSKVYREYIVKDRQVFHCLVIGAHNSGKSSVLASFLGTKADPRRTPSTVVNSVDMPGGKQSYLVMQKLSLTNESLLDSLPQLSECDVLCLTYDSADPNSFAHLVALLKQHPVMHRLPLVFAALKADQDRAQQRCEMQPDEYTSLHGIAAPMHVSSDWPSSLQALYVRVVEAALRPGLATMTMPGDKAQPSILPELLGVATAVASAAAVSWWWTYRWRSQ